MLGRIEQHALGRFADALQDGLGRMAHRAARRDDVDDVGRRLAARRAAASFTGGASPRPSAGRMPGEAAIATQNAAQIATAATNQAHHGALS